MSGALARKNKSKYPCQCRNAIIKKKEWRAIYADLYSAYPWLAKLLLNDNNINDSSCAFLSGFKSLTLGRNSNMTIAWQTLFDYLKSPTCILEELDLDGNSFNDDTAILLFTSLANNCSLKSLNLSGSFHQVGNMSWTAVSGLLYKTPNQCWRNLISVTVQSTMMYFFCLHKLWQTITDWLNW